MIDVKMFSEGKKRFSELYTMSAEKRQKLRKEDAYRLARMDLWEMAATASGIATNTNEFYILLGKVVYGFLNEKYTPSGNIEDPI